MELLNQVDVLKSKYIEADAKAARILPALFYKMFGDPATNPKGWPIGQINELVDPIFRHNPRNWPDKPFIYIDIAGVDGQYGVIAETKRLIGSEAPSRARQIVQTHDIIISTVRPYLRVTALVPNELDGHICSTGFCVLRSIKGLGFGFLYGLSRLSWFTEQLNSRARGASYPAVTDKDILDLPMPIPNSIELLKTFDIK